MRRVLSPACCALLALIVMCFLSPLALASAAEGEQNQQQRQQQRAASSPSPSSSEVVAAASAVPPKKGEGQSGLAQPQPRSRPRQQLSPSPRRANLLFIARADRALLSRSSLVLLGLQPAVFYVADEPTKHSGRIRATELFNGSMWRSGSGGAAPLARSSSSSPSSSSSSDDDEAPAAAALSWLGSPSALLEGARVGSSGSPFSSSSSSSPRSASPPSSPAVTLPLSIADPRLLRGGARGSLELTLAAGGTGTGSGVLEGGVVAAAIDASGRAGFGRGKAAGNSGGGFLADPRREVVAAEAASLKDKKESSKSSSSSPQGAEGDGVLELRDVALYIDVAAPTTAEAEAEEAAESKGGSPSSSSSPSSAPLLGAKQGITSFYGCSGSPLGTLSSFGNACGLYGSGYFGGGMLGDQGFGGGGGTIG